MLWPKFATAGLTFADLTSRKAGAEKINLDETKEKEKNAPPTVTVDLPRDYNEAWETVHKFQSAGQVDERIADSVAHYSTKGTGSLMDEPWSGTEESERLAYVTEELYIHSSESLNGLAVTSVGPLVDFR